MKANYRTVLLHGTVCTSIYYNREQNQGTQHPFLSSNQLPNTQKEKAQERTRDIILAQISCNPGSSSHHLSLFDSLEFYAKLDLKLVNVPLG